MESMTHWELDACVVRAAVFKLAGLIGRRILHSAQLTGLSTAVGFRLRWLGWWPPSLGMLAMIVRISAV